MSRKQKILEKINKKLIQIASIINQPDQYAKASDLLWDVYEKWCGLDQYSSKDEAARDLFDLSDNLEVYHDSFDEDDDNSLDFLVDKVEQIKHVALRKINDVSRDYDENNSASDSELTDSEEDKSSDNEADLLAESLKDKLKFDSRVVYEALLNPYGDNCSLQHVRVKEAIVQSTTHHHAVPYHTIYAELTRTSRKTGQVKYKFNPESIHHRQRITVNKQKSNQGNTIVVDLSFEIKATQPNGVEKRFTIDFPLDIPQFDRSCDADNDTYNFSQIGVDQEAALKTLKTLYWHGRAVRKIPKDDKHGQTPKHDGSSGDKQFNYHTEQALSIYLCQPKAATMIANRLVSEIRSQHEDLAYGSTIKVYHAALHIHSDKTPCGACEYTLLGLQNTWRNDGQSLKGFTELLENAFLEKTQDFNKKNPGSYFQFNFPGQNKPERSPQQRGIRMFTLFIADGKDGTHKSCPVASKSKALKQKEIAPSILETRERGSARYLWTVNFGCSLPDQVLVQSSPDTSQRTTFLSGSNSTPAAKKTKSKIGEMKEQELGSITTNLFFDIDVFYFEEKNGNALEFKLEEISAFDAKQRFNSCGFNVLNTTREDFLQNLNNNLHKNEIASLVYEHIVNAWRYYCMHNNQKSEALMFLKQHKHFQTWFAKYGKLPNVNGGQLTKIFSIEDLKKFLKKEIIIDSAGLSGYLMQAWAKATNAGLNIYVPTSNNKPQLKQLEDYTYLPLKPRAIFNVLYTDTHYDCLKVTRALVMAPNAVKQDSKGEQNKVYRK